jgi:IrrE N-terminal-like domain
MNMPKIEGLARQLHIELWERRRDFWPEREPSPFEILDPELAAEHLGIGYALSESLGRFGARGMQFEVAGSLDRQRGVISVSRKFPAETMRFTGAHEIGHWLLHPGEVMHRDRPIKGLEGVLEYTRPLEEKEADFFAGCFLMPERLLQKTFHRLFGRNFSFDEESAFELSPNDFAAFLRPQENSLSREMIMANAQRFNGVRFRSLAEQFSVSPKSMAIRLRELNLTPWP